jgi:hypothetical protein
MQPLYATLLSYPKQYATALGNRLWKRYMQTERLHWNAKRLTLLCGSSICQPFMEMAGKQSSNL